MYIKKNIIGIIEEITFDFFPQELSADLRHSIESGLAVGATITNCSDSLSILRKAVAETITAIEGRSKILQRFLNLGPYWSEGDIPNEMKSHCLSDEETAEAVRFIYHHMVNCFQGKLAELLAIEPCIQIMNNLKAKKKLPNDAKLLIGDSVLTGKIKVDKIGKGADFHILHTNTVDNTVELFAVGEVKSYIRSQKKLKQQLDDHVKRAKYCMKIGDKIFAQDNIIKTNSIIKISCVPSSWKLSKEFTFENIQGKTFLNINNTIPTEETIISQVRTNEWRIILKWSYEALAQAAYELTFWYMAKLGEQIFSEKLPKGIKNMTPSQAGQNAAKEKLYFTIVRSRTIREEQRAIALYNMYGFGYSIGMNYKNKEGKREMLYIEALHEILSNGIDRYGCKIR